MIVTNDSYIVVERLNSARTWIDDDETQIARFATLNDQLLLWLGILYKLVSCANSCLSSDKHEFVYAK